MNALVPASNVEAYRASTDAAELCRQMVVTTAMTIQGRKYVKLEGWQSIAIAHGCTGSARDVERVEGGVRAVGEVRRMSDGRVIATAEGFVGEDEPTWFGGKMGSKTLPKRPDYAIRAMAQTRAISRACRSAFAHVVVMMNAGLSTTPYEEVPPDGFDADPTPAEKPPTKAALKRSGIYEELRDEIDGCKSVEELEAWNLRRAKDIKALPADWYDALGDRFQVRREELEGAASIAEDESELDEAFRARVGVVRGSELPRRDVADRAEATA
jgi:hypothetical protein